MLNPMANITNCSMYAMYGVIQENTVGNKYANTAINSTIQDKIAIE